MTVVMNLEWPGMTREQYNQVIKAGNIDSDPAEGGIFHVASFSERGLHVTDVWESEEHFQRFLEARLMPAVQQAGVTEAPPPPVFRQVHNIIQP